MNITNDGISITNRFFQAIDILKCDRKLRGLGTFARAHFLNRWNLITLRDQPDSRYLQPEWIAWLCKDYNVSSEWILFGTGYFYKNNQAPNIVLKNKPRKKQTLL